MHNRIIVWIWSCLFPLFSLGQVDLTPSAIRSAAFQVEDVFSLTLTNHTGSPIRVYLEGELKDVENTTVVHLQSVLMEMAPGTHSFQPSEIPLQQVEGSGEISAGSYTLCIYVIDNDTRQQLNQNCRTRTYQDSQVGRTFNGSASSDGPISFSGQIRLTGQTSNQVLPFQEIPPHFARLQASTSISAFGIPIRGEVFLSTEAQSTGYDLNRINFQLDTRQVLSNLQQKASQRIGDQLDMDIPTNPELLNRLGALKEEAYQTALKQLPKGFDPQDSTLLDQLEDLEQLDRIKDVLSRPSFQEIVGQCEAWEMTSEDWDETEIRNYVDSLAEYNLPAYRKHQLLISRCKELRRLEEKREELEALEKKLRKLQRYQAKLEKVQKLKDGNYQQLLNNPDHLRSLGILSKGEKLLASVRKFGIGTVVPFYSPLSLNGVAVKGLDVAVNPGNFYAAVTGGNVTQPVFRKDSFQNPYKTRLIAGKTGYGKEEGSHLFATFLYADEVISAKAIDSTRAHFSPRTNWIYGLEGQLTLFAKRVRLQGEWMRSILESASGAAYIPGADTLSWIDDPFNGARKVEGNAWSLLAQVDLSANTKFLGRLYRVLPGYYSMGSPWLITDRQRYEVRGDQTLWKGKWVASTYLKRDYDRLLPYKFTRTTVTSAGVNLSYRPRKGPYMTLNFAPLYRQNDRMDSLAFRDQVSVISLNSGYNWKMGDISASSSVVYSQQMSRSLSGQTDYSARMMTINQAINFAIPLSFAATASYIHTDWSADFNETFSLDVSGSFTLFDKWHTTLGGLILEEKGGVHRKGLFFTTSFPLFKNMQFELQGQHHFYDGVVSEYPKAFEYIYQGVLGYRW